MSETTEAPAGFPALSDLWVPAGDSGSVPMDWSEHIDESDGEPRWTSYEGITCYADDGSSVTLVAGDGGVFGAVLNGEFVDAETVRERAEEYDADVDDLDQLDADERAGWEAARRALEAIEPAELEGAQEAQGPMMNYYYPLASDFRKSAAELAALIADLPLCVVELADGRLVLALSGGGMDLTWEIGEAHVRCGFFPPAWLNFPAAMDADGLNDRRRYVLRAAATHLWNTARNAESMALRLEALMG